MKKFVLLLALVACWMASGCGSYYQVTDPRTSAVYYTDKVDRQQSGSVMFKDARTGATVTLPASSIQEIPKEKYDTERSATPAPVATATTGPS